MIHTEFHGNCYDSTRYHGNMVCDEVGLKSIVKYDLTEFRLANSI